MMVVAVGEMELKCMNVELVGRFRKMGGGFKMAAVGFVIQSMVMVQSL